MWWPWMLPDGRRYLVWAGGRRKEVRVGSINPTTVTRLTGAESRAVYAPPGYLLFVREGTLMAQAFDVKTLQVTGTPTPIADGLLYFKDVGQADFSASDTGVLVYQAGTTASRLAWLARNGNEEGQVGQPADYFFLRLSPTGRRVAVDVMDRRAGTSDLQVFDLARRGALTHVTADEFMDWMPVFSPDEQQLAFASARGSPPRMHLKRLNESGTGTALVPPSSLQFVTDWVSGPEGQFLVFSEERPDSLGDVFMLPLSGGGRPRPLVQTPADEADGRVSPDGRSIAYVSNESGRSEVYVRALGGTTDRVQVSTGGGVSPRWRRDGGELYYLATVSAVTFAPTVVDGQLMAVSVTMKPDFRAGIPAPLFSARFRQGQYEPAADGRRFLVNLGSGSAALPITVVTNWTRVLPK